MTSIMPTYNRYPVTFVSGEGTYLTADDGRRFLDGLSGIAVCVLGHAHPKVADALSTQANKLIHTSNLYGIPEQEILATTLCEISGMDNVFFCNSGAESNEAALKLARKYGNDRGVSVPTTLVIEGSFHGRTLATLTATGQEKVRAGFDPLPLGFEHIPFNDVGAVEERAVDPNVVAILVEPILGEGGVHVPADNYLEELRRVCDANNMLLMLDEVQTGNGRTGKYFAFQHTTILPDVVTLAKGLANGVPIGACLARGVAAETLVAGTHASTFGGNPLACAAANATIAELRDGVIEQAARTGQRMRDAFAKNLADCNNVKEIRGKGMMIGIELTEPCAELVLQAMDKGLLMNVTTDTVVRLLPPLNITSDEADQMVEIVTDLIKNHV
ncbi:MAG: aspartate aminotransferase family protein [Gammaproteobacteria bacterium]|nr:aspartate aminotransferase family protein [Gammaproteobacteria bacterium]